MINFARSWPADPVMGSLPWPTIARSMSSRTVRYCQEEQRFYSQKQPGVTKHTVRFRDFVNDLEGTLRNVYGECLHQPVPASVPTVHPPRNRTDYMLNRCLGEVGVNVRVLRELLHDYYQQC